MILHRDGRPGRIARGNRIADRLVLGDDGHEAMRIARLLLAVVTHDVRGDQADERGQHRVARGVRDGQMQREVLVQRRVAAERLRTESVLRVNDGFYLRCCRAVRAGAISS